MKTIIFTLTLLITTSTWAKIVYVNNNDQAVTLDMIDANNLWGLSIDIDNDGTKDIVFEIRRWCCSSCPDPKGGTIGGTTYTYSTYPMPGCMIYTLPDCTSETLNYNDEFSNSRTQIATLIGNVFCTGKTGSYKLGFRLTKKNPVNNVNGFIYGYIDYSLTTSGDIIVHGWYYNDAFNEPIIANNTTKYPYNGCVYQDTIKTYVNVNVYDTIKIPKTVYDTIKITKIEIVKKTVYDTIKVEKIIHKTICDSTVLVKINDTVTKIIYDTIKTHVTIKDTIHKTIYTNVKVKVYDTINVPIAVTDTLIIKLNNTKETQIRIWPNPTQQSITIDRSDNKDGDIIIIDQNGKTLVNMKANTQILQLDVSQWSVGTYTLIIKENENTITKHLQIIR